MHENKPGKLGNRDFCSLKSPKGNDSKHRYVDSAMLSQTGGACPSPPWLSIDHWEENRKRFLKGKKKASVIADEHKRCCSIQC